jgi:uncharacterized protein YndB with AHSA1/START domain
VKALVVSQAEATVTVDRPVAEVFAFVADGTNNARWRPAVTDVELANGDAGQVGAVWRQGMRGPMGRRVDADYEITEYVPDRRLGFKVVAGPARPTGRYDFEPAGSSSTRVTFALSHEPKGAARLMGPMVARQLPKEVAQLHELKRVLEASSS